MKWAQWINALIGIWFIISPWTLNYSNYTGAVWFSVIFGAIQLIVSFWAAVQTETPGWASWQSWVALVMGILFIIEAVSWPMSAGAAWTNVILGAVTIILDLIAMGATHSSESHSSSSHHAHA